MRLSVKKITAYAGAAMLLTSCNLINFNEALAVDVTGQKTSVILAQIIDKKLVTKGGFIVLNKQGEITGNVDSNAVTGSWSEKDGYYCRSVTYGSKRTDTDCQIILNTSEGLFFHRHRGGGRKVGPYFAQDM